MLKKRYFILGLVLGFLNILLFYFQAKVMGVGEKQLDTTGIYMNWLMWILFTGVLGSILDGVSEEFYKRTKKK